MKILTVLGTRPEIIRLSGVIELLDNHCDHTLVHTGQNYDDRLSRIFFEELGVREPDIYLGLKAGSFAGQIGRLLEMCERVFLEKRPDRLLILGDTNSGMSAIVARRLGIPVYHMEAGNRCYDDRVPEEVNRRVIDHTSTVLMPYTRNSMMNLVREGFEGNRIYVTGNPIREVMKRYESNIASSKVLDEMELEAGQYLLVTMHREENVDREDRLKNLVAAFDRIYDKYGYRVICSTHPRTMARIEQYSIRKNREGQVSFLTPFGFFDFITLERNAFCTLSDSGTVQEEACIMGVPNVTIRDVTERPETLECGSNILSGVEPDAILEAVELVTSRRGGWNPPEEYMRVDVSRTVVRIVLSYRIPDTAELHWNSAKRVGS